MNFIKTLFSPIGIALVLYVIIGVAVNTASPHLPQGSSLTSVHSWLQYLISVTTWPLSFWHPHFTTGQWHP